MGRLVALLRLFGVAVVVCGCVASGASALSGGRVYEMVSPPYKEGYGVNVTRVVAQDGERVVFTSQGGFAGTLSGGVNASHSYLSRRGELGWTTVSVEPPFGGVSDVSVGLEYVLASGPVGPNSGWENYADTEQEYLLHNAVLPDTAESWGVFGGIGIEEVEGKHFSVSEEGASGDLCHVVIGKAEGPLLAEAVGTTRPIYDLSSGCGGAEPYLRLIALDNGSPPRPINPVCVPEIGTGRYVDTPVGTEQGDNFNAVDFHGDEIFFTTDIQEEAGNCGSVRAKSQVFVRLGGVRTLEVSRPLEAGAFGGCSAGGVAGEVPCDGAAARESAYFKGASEDGSRVFFTTTAPLTGGGGVGGNDLYMATIGCPGVEPLSTVPPCEVAQREVTSLTQVSKDPNASGAAEVQGVVNTSANGERIYYVARGVLTGEPNGDCGQPVPCEEGLGGVSGCCPKLGADNLYVYNSVTGTNSFVAELCSGPARSGVDEDVYCPRDLTEDGGDRELLWSRGLPEAQSTQDGAFLVFCSYGQLVAGDTDSAKDVYRYDAQTGVLERVSIGVKGHDANGNNDAFDANIALGESFGSGQETVYLQHELTTRAISEDGSRIVFDTAEPLSPAATNGRVDIYEWDEGNVSLISSGTSEEDDIEAMITPSGRDVMFLTSQGLVRADTDGLPDIYDARIGGGFPEPPAPLQPCSGDACQGPLTNPAPLLVPGSVSQAPGGNFSEPTAKTVVKPKKKAKAKKVKAKKKKKKKGMGKASARARRASRVIVGGGR